MALALASARRLALASALASTLASTLASALELEALELLSTPEMPSARVA